MDRILNRTCRCGNKLPPIGRLCAKCAAEKRSARMLSAPKIPRRARIVTGERSPAHLRWVRTLPCAVIGCTGKDMHAHHVRVRSGGGMGKKPSDRFSVPLCFEHHAEGHKTGWSTFEARHMLDLRALAQELAALSPHLGTPGTWHTMTL